MINVIKKISIIVILMLSLAIIFSGSSQATIGNIFQDADDFLGEGDSVASTINEKQLQETSDFLYKLLLAIGIIVMFIVGTILGIQFMVASAEDKAKVKEALVPYIVGCVVIFGAFTIWSLVVNLGQDVMGEGNLQTSTCELRVQCQMCSEVFELWYWEEQNDMNNPECPGCHKTRKDNAGGSIHEYVYKCNNCDHINFRHRLEKRNKCAGCGVVLTNYDKVKK